MASQDGQLGPQQQQTVVVSVSNSMAQLGNIPQPQQQQGIPPPTAPSAISMTSLHHPQQMNADWGQGRVQVIHPQPYLQQIYSSNGQQILVPSNISLHPGINNQQIQVIATGKPFHGGQMGPHMMSPSQGKQVQIQQGQSASFPGYTIPTSQNQTFMFSPMNVISSQQSILPVQSQTNTVMTGQSKNNDLQKILGQRNGQQKGATQQVITSPTNTQIQLPIQNASQPIQYSQWQLPQVWGGQLLGPNPIFIRGPAPTDGTTFIQHPPTIQQAQPTLALPCLGQQGQSSGPGVGIGKAVRPLSNILPSSTAPLRQPNSAGSNASTQTAMQVQANAAKQAKIRSKIVGGHAVNTSVTQKQDAANQTNKVQLPSSVVHHIPKQQNLVAQSPGQGSTDHISVTPDKNQMNKILQQQQHQAVMFQHQQAVLQHQQQHQMVQQLAQQQLVVQYQNNQNPHMQNKNMMGMTVSNMANTMPVVPINQNLQINSMSVQQPLPMMQMQHTINQNDLISPQNSLQPPQNPMSMLGHPHHASPPPQPPLAAQQHQQHLQLTPLQMQHLQQSLQTQHLQLNQQNQQINQQTQLNQLPPQTHQAHHNNITLQTQQAQHNQLTSQTQQSQQEQQLQLTQVQQQLQIQPMQHQQMTNKQNVDNQQSTSNFDTSVSRTVTSVQFPDGIKVENVHQPSTVMDVVANIPQETEMVTFSKPTLILNQEDIINKEKQIYPAGISSSVTADVKKEVSFFTQNSTSKSPKELEVAKVITEIASVAGGHYSTAPSPSSEHKSISKNLSELQILESAVSSDAQSQKAETCTLSNADISLQMTVVPMSPTTSVNKVTSSTATSVAVSSPNGSQLLILDKRLPKAMVKPNILTHVIEGFVIQEASEPFAVSRPVQEWMAERAQTSLEERNREEVAPKSPVRKNGNIVNEGVLGIQRIVEEGKCHCGKAIKTSKKFCSPSCSRKPQPKKHSVPAKSLDSALARLDIINHNETNTNEISSASSTVESLKNENGTNQEPAALKWNVEQVADFIKKIPGCAMYAEEFVLQEVDGEALILIKPEHLVMSMSIKLGPALKIVASIDTLRPDKALSGETSADEVSPSTSNKSLPVFPTAAKKRKFTM